MAAGTKTSASFSLTPAVSWSPEARVTVYYIQSDGDIVSDTVHVPIDQLNHVLSFISPLHYILIGAQSGNALFTVPELLC